VQFHQAVSVWTLVPLEEYAPTATQKVALVQLAA